MIPHAKIGRNIFYLFWHSLAFTSCLLLLSSLYIRLVIVILILIIIIIK